MRTAVSKCLNLTVGVVFMFDARSVFFPVQRSFIFILAKSFFFCRLKPKKQSKEIEKERPPWRSAATSTQPEAKRSALLRAKILDATRRALLAQRISHVATQTEFGAILMGEKSIDVQKDLIQMVDKSEDTDGAITIRRDRPGGCKSFV